MFACCFFHGRLFPKNWFGGFVDEKPVQSNCGRCTPPIDQVELANHSAWISTWYRWVVQVTPWMDRTHFCWKITWKKSGKVLLVHFLHLEHCFFFFWGFFLLSLLWPYDPCGEVHKIRRWSKPLQLLSQHIFGIGSSNTSIKGHLGTYCHPNTIL